MKGKGAMPTRGVYWQEKSREEPMGNAAAVSTVIKGKGVVAIFRVAKFGNGGWYQA